MSEELVKKMGLGQSAVALERHRDKRPHTGFIGGLFQGKANFELFHEPYFDDQRSRDKADAFIKAAKQHFLTSGYDPEEIDRTHEIPAKHLEWFCDNGFYGLKIPERFGGADLTQTSYMRVMGVLSYCGGLIASVSAANTIGVGYPVNTYGSDEQKLRFLPIAARNPSGFAFTEKEAGSDPAKMRLVAVRVFRDGKLVGYRLNGIKWWTTNGPRSDKEFLSPLLCVIGKIVNDIDELDQNAKNENYHPCFGAFIVPTTAALTMKIRGRAETRLLEEIERVRHEFPEYNWSPSPIQRCYFTGLNGIYNGPSEFKDVFVPVGNLIGKRYDEKLRDELRSLGAPEEVLQEQLELAGAARYYQEGEGFKIAIEALNNGRITIAGSAGASARQMLSMAKWHCNNRNQLGLIGKHEAIGSGMLAPGLADTFATEAMAKFAAGRADRDQDCRLEAGAAKDFAAERCWKIADHVMQIFSGRGYETAHSKAKRGEPALPVDRNWRGMRPNRIFEGATELLSAWGMREGSDSYKKRGEPLMKYKSAFVRKALGVKEFLPDILKLSMPSRNGFRKSDVDSALHEHINYIRSAAKRLAKKIIVLSGKYQLKLGKKQLLMNRLFWIVTEIGHMGAACFDGTATAKMHGKQFIELADFYCNEARLRIEHLFWEIDHNNDAQAREIATKFLAGEFDAWLKRDILPAVDVLGLEK